MSRSYRAPVWSDGQKSRGSSSGPSAKAKSKRDANKAVRRDKNVASGSSFKKVFNSWNICDWKFYDPKSAKVRRK